MRKLLNTLYVNKENAYLALDGENVVVKENTEELARFPLHTLENIISFSYAGASPALMGACSKRDINLCFCTPNGRFLARTVGETSGNVLLRRTQYRIADDLYASKEIAKNMIYGKIYNSRWNIERTLRDNRLRVNTEKLSDISQKLQNALSLVKSSESLEYLRGIEGESASLYFSAFDEMILNNKSDFFFKSRSRRPPLDKLNALLSFAYTLLTNECVSALESVGLDSYVGFMHRDRSGRHSLALDLMEEFRSCFADRFVITLVNNRIIKASDFIDRESGAVILTDEGRKAVLKSWQERKSVKIKHPYLEEEIPWGLVPYTQALLLSRYLRDDIDGYPPFLWK